MIALPLMWVPKLASVARPDTRSEEVDMGRVAGRAVGASGGGWLECGTAKVRTTCTVARNTATSLLPPSRLGRASRSDQDTKRRERARRLERKCEETSQLNAGAGVAKQGGATHPRRTAHGGEAARAASTTCCDASAASHSASSWRASTSGAAPPPRAHAEDASSKHTLTQPAECAS